MKAKLFTILMGAMAIIAMVVAVMNQGDQGLVLYITVCLGFCLLFVCWGYHHSTTLLDDASKVVADKSRIILNMVSLQSDTQADKEKLSHELNALRDRFMAEHIVRTNAERDSRNLSIVIRRLNAILKENGIDATAANIPPADAGSGELVSSSVARGNPVPPPGLSADQRAQVVPQSSARVSMARPNPSSAPVSQAPVSGNSDFLTGAMVGSMLCNDPAPARSESSCSSSRDSGGYDSSSSSSDSSSSPSSCD